MLKIAIVIGSTRPARNAVAVARWVYERASQRGDAMFEIVDIKEFSLPIFDEPLPPAMGQAVHAHTKRWANVIEAFDAYVFVTPEYNRAPPAALKNALDFLYREWHDKAAGFVSFGVDLGSSAVQQLRIVVSELRMASVQAQVGLSLSADFEHYTIFKPLPQRGEVLNRMLDQLVTWAVALRNVRRGASIDSRMTSEGRPVAGRNSTDARESREAVEHLVTELQTGLDHHDAKIYNRHFAADVAWGSPNGQIVLGFDPLHAIHMRLLTERKGGASVRYEVENILAPAHDIAVAHVKKVALDANGQPVAAAAETSGAFSEMALYVLVRRGADWWLAAGQNTPVRRSP